MGETSVAHLNKASMDNKLIDLALILSDRLPDVNLEDMLLKMRDFETWNSYIVHDE